MGFINNLFNIKNGNLNFPAKNITNINKYDSSVFFELDISPEIAKNITDVINRTINKDVAAFGKSVMNDSMMADIPRMNYHINDKKISVPGNAAQSKINFSNAIMEPQNAWLQEHIGSLSSFLHQGIFSDFFGAVDTWKANDGSLWGINMVSLDRHTTDTSFYIYNTGIVKFISQAKILNVMLRNHDIILTKKETSVFALQLTFRVVKMPNNCLILMPQNASDGCRLKFQGMGLLD